MWKINQKVVCVCDDWRERKNEIVPVKGEIYTVRDIYPDGTGIRLNEIINTPRQYSLGFRECFFKANHFRPVDEKFGEEVAEKLEKEFISQPEPALV